MSTLTGSLIQAYADNQVIVQIKISGDDVKLSIDKASPLSLALNEIISNSFKYAFPDGREGLIELKAQKQDNHFLVLTIEDNGVGFPEGFDWKNSASLGLSLVRSLIEQQLNGAIELDTGEGARFTIKLNLDPNYI